MVKVGDWFVPNVPLSFVLEHIQKIKQGRLSYDIFVFGSDDSFRTNSVGTTLKVFESAMGNGRRKATLTDFRRMIKKVLER